ncbi:sentrin-specific protease 5-like [Syngnathus acus]|uniref:sentrin-specific protease 5-like n=1 Tax=Syngnathus acus TaxID=161584 RepID=UPI0018860DF0|nr:sentrin-specific protease 5-like [Syngnathus acus]XP_037105983.1 sentrin-specific protease 5-like [Syngnathus acus]XP_037105984.1 sentrin-specific protease 5-like [Syngnathus acus]
MVHSNSASPMKTSLPPNITEAAPPEQAAPLPVLPLIETSDKDPSHIQAKALDSNVTSISNIPQPTTQNLAEAGSPVLTPKTALQGNSSPASDWSSSHPATHAHSTINGRTSGRKRTPKTCDCCGPNKRGHDVTTSGRGKGRGRGRGRGSGRNIHDKSGDDIMGIIDFDLTGDVLEDVEDKNDIHEGMKISTTQPGPTVPSRVCISLLDGNVLDNGQADFPQVSVPASKGGTFIGMKQGVENDNSENAQTLSDSGAHVNSASVTSQVGNGDSLGLSETESKRETLDDKSGETGNGTLCSSGGSASPSRPASPQNHDSEMQVELERNRTDSSSLCLSPLFSNGNESSPAERDPGATAMETDCANPSALSTSNRDPIRVCSTQYSCALIDHRLYCHPATWEKNLSEETDVQEMDGDTPSDSLERLIILVHDFLEGFYIKYGSFIPLSETDVLEYLKTNGDCGDFRKLGLNIQREMARYKAALASAPVAGFMVIYNKHTLSLEDLGTLEDQNWINDQIINTYGDLIMEAAQHNVHFFNSFFHKQLDAKGYEGVKRWTKKVDLFSKWLLLIPIHLEIHWSLVSVTMATKTINYFDSQGIVFRHTADNIMKYLQSEAQEKKKTEFLKGWKIAIIKGIPQQKNDSDCGVFVLEYCRCLSLKKPLLFSQDDMPRIRKRIYKELCDRHLNS